MAWNHQDLIGKTISKVIVAEGEETPKSQMFLVFSDGTYVELFCEDRIRVAAATRGDAQLARSRARNKVILEV